jgi:serine/threonine protein kinase
VNCSFTDVTQIRDKHLLRQELIRYLKDGGIDVQKSHFQIAVDKCFRYYFSEIQACISSHYCLTLRALTYPLPYAFVHTTGERLLEAINKVSDIGFSINDVKPENVYLDSAGNVDIGDFGGYSAFGDRIVEYTPEYLCEELINTPVTKMNDRMCLVATLLALVERKPSRVTVDSLRNACVSLPEVKNDGDGLLKRFLLSLFPKK